MANKTKNSKKRLITVFVIAFSLIAALVCASFIYPMAVAKSELKKSIAAFENIDALDVMQVYDPLYQEGDFYGGITADVSHEDACGIARQLIEFAENAEYVATVESVMGSWDVSVVIRKNDGSVARIYFTDEGFYVATDTVQYKFRPDDERADSFASLSKELCERIVEKRRAEA